MLALEGTRFAKPFDFAHILSDDMQRMIVSRTVKLETKDIVHKSLLNPAFLTAHFSHCECDLPLVADWDSWAPSSDDGSRLTSLTC